MEPEEYTRMYRLEESYWWFVGRRRLVRTLLSRLGLEKLPPGSHVLDLGCGTGAVSRELQELGHVASLDFSAAALSMSRTRGLTGLCQGDAESLPFRSDVFRLATALDVVEHLDDDRAAMAELYRVLAPGGVAVVTVPAFQALWSEHDVALHHRRRYTRSEVRRLVTDSGFRILKLSYVMTLLSPLVALVRVFQKLRPAKPGEERASLPEVGPRTNRLLTSVLALEASLVSAVNLPFGVSIVCVARKEAA